VASFIIAKIKEQEDLVTSMQTRLENWLLQFRPRQTERLDRIRQTIQQAVTRYLMKQNNQLDQLGLRIKASDPREVFRRGYALVENDKGEKVRSVQHVTQGDILHVFMKDGQVITKIEQTYSYVQEKN
jgi:exodeoxyribonuclease VII large subunit